MAGKLPYIQFFVGDWIRDSISGCSLAAQGLWLRMMILAHDSERYGYLSINGTPIPPEHIAGRCGLPLEQYVTLLAELDAAAVPSRTPEGIIYSRRMVRDAKARAANAVRVGNHRRKKASVCNVDVMVDVTPSSEDEDINLRKQIKALYEAYPRKIAKSDAEKAIKRALAREKFPVLLEAVQEFAKVNANKERQYLPYPATWFNASRWTDDREEWYADSGFVPDSWWTDWHPAAGKRIAHMTNKEKNQWDVPVGLPEPKVVKPK